MPGPNLLDALRAHLQTGEIPESLRETLAGQGVLVPTEAQSGQSGSSEQPGALGYNQGVSPRIPRSTRSTRAGTQRQVSGKLSIEELEGGGDGVLAAPGAAGTPAVGGAGARAAGAGSVLPGADAAGTGPAAEIAFPTRVTPAGEIEPGLPDPGPAPTPAEILAARAHVAPIRLAAFGEGDPQTQRRLGRADTRRLTTDETLEADLKASLEVLGVEPDPGVEATHGVLAAAPIFEIPVDLDDLPLFAYVCGAAGVGKTFWAKEVSRRAGDAVVLAATTGIASVNLGEGTTINSYLRYFDTASLREAYTGGYLEASLKKHRATGLQRILLDEVSMLNGEQLTILCRAIDNVNQDKPEGVPDLGLILLGDFAQLAPVPDRDPSDPKGFKKLPVAFAFESAEWDRFASQTFTLRTIRRQADRDFIEALQATRRGAVGAALEYFRDKFQSTTDMHYPGPTIVAKNDAVGKYNQLRLDAVQGAKVEWRSERWGKVRPEWGAPPKPEHEWGVPPVLKMKIGARVMILANKNVAGKDEPPVWAYTNGDLGTLKEASDGGALVTLDRTGTDVWVGMLQRFNEIPLEPGRRKALKAEGHPERVSEDGKREYIGGITYLPLRLAYATTVHKSQGLSLDQVQINIRDPFFAQSGMLYVALSRARTVEGLRLVGTPEGFRARCNVNPKLKGYL